MLRELQKNFFAGIYSRNHADDVLEFIEDGDTLNAADLLTVYRGSIFGGINNALAEIYPVVKKLVGDTFFDMMMLRYIKQHPSHSPDFNTYGEHMAEFISLFTPAASLPYLADVARLEWAWHQAFYAADNQTLDFTTLGNVNAAQQDTIIFQCQPGSSLLSSDYPVHHIWQANQDDSTQQHIELAEGSVQLLIWRKGLDMHIDVLGKEQWQLLSLIQKQLPLGEVCEQFAALHPHTDFNEVLSDSITNKWIGGFYLAESR